MTTRPRATLAAWLLVVVSLGGLATACGGGNASLLGSSPDAAVQRADEQAILNARSKAVLDGNLAQFMAPVDRTDKAFVRRQRRLFHNLTQLPLERYSATVLAASWPSTLIDPAWGAKVWLPEVKVTTEFNGFDAKPVQQLTGLAFAEKDNSLVLVNDRTRTGDTFPGSHPAPWDLTTIHVKQSYGVLAIFDDQMLPKAAEVTAAVQQGIEDDSGVLPFTWSGRVVVYCFANKAVLSSFDDVPGGDINHLGAMTFPVYADTARHQRAGMRFTVLPSSVEAGQPFLGRIIRHELSHVAIGTRDDGDPTWVSEGIAEWMGARPLPLSQREIPTSALARAREGTSSMPASSSFNGADQEWNYALSWMAFDYIASAEGESKVWALMNALHHNGAGTSDADQDAVVSSVLGYDSHELARRAAARIVRLYG